MKMWCNLMLAAGFGLGLLLPTLGLLRPVANDHGINENRVLTPFPEWWHVSGDWLGFLNPVEAKRFFFLVERFYNDHFGFRHSWVAAGLTIKRTISPEELGSQVLLGRDGWLFLKQEWSLDLVGAYQGLNPYTQSQLKDAQLELEAKRDWLAARGIKYLFVIAPEKASIYPEHLPASLKPATTTRTDQLVEYLRLHSMVAVLDLRPALRRARQKFPVYYKTDPHWNLPGAFVACQTILSHLSSQFPGLVPFDGDAFSIQWRPGTGGCEASLADEPYLAEANRFVFLPGPALPELEFRTPDNHPLGLQQIWGLPSLETGFTTTNSRRSRRVEVFGDSFASYLQPFLGFHFGTTIYHYRTRFDKVSVNKAQPDLVIEETVERYLWGR